ncbi:MAG: 50S ribosomal protein L2 [Puniceicoccales bacterium]|jgi:large subunit ribosomal protein L2|nr:50S ribosomal protein L2 [Puniceicoccales bacterium]
MAIIPTNPNTPGQRFLIRNKQTLSKKRPEKSLTESIHNHKGGRNCYGRITSRRRGGGHKRLYRNVDFRRDLLDVNATVLAFEYDPNRSANLALIQYENPEKTKSYILAPDGLKVGDTIFATKKQLTEFTVGLSLPLRNIPPATNIHAIEIEPGRGAAIARGAGVFAQLLGVEGAQAILKMPSGEQRYLNADCRATIGIVGNIEHQNQSLGKAGRNRWLGKRPRVRGMVMNPVDHPNGGGQGKSKGGGGRQHLRSPWGQLSKGFPTRTKSKPSNSQIIVRRNGKKVKKG